MASQTRIAELADIIAIKTRVVDDYLRSQGLPAPSFETNGPLTIPVPTSEREILEAQYQVIACTQELNDLMKGPTEVLFTRFVGVCSIDVEEYGCY
jgi:hypothetical protein